MCKQVLYLYFNYLIFSRSGVDEELTEKKQLLQEIADLVKSGAEHLARMKMERKEKDKEAAKKLKLLKKGEDIRLRAMQGLKGISNFRIK